MVVDGKYRKAIALPCLMSEPLPNAANSSDVLRLDSMLRELRKLLCYNKQGCFSWENVFGPPKNHGCGQKKPEGTSSARFGLRTAAKCGELKRCADRVGSRTDNKDVKVVEGKFSNLNFCLPPKRQLSILLNFFFPFVDV